MGVDATREPLSELIVKLVVAVEVAYVLLAYEAAAAFARDISGISLCVQADVPLLVGSVTVATTALAEGDVPVVMLTVTSSGPIYLRCGYGSGERSNPPQFSPGVGRAFLASGSEQGSRHKPNRKLSEA